MAGFHSIEEMQRAGCTTARGVRYWEENGLLGDVQRSDGGTHRRFTDEQLNRARIIAAAQFGGFPLEQIKEMLAGYDAEVYEALMTRLADQTRAAVRLGEQLPVPQGYTAPGEAVAPEYDL
jgi:DNA-binding transcriptional MerR regulator